MPCVIEHVIHLFICYCLEFSSFKKHTLKLLRHTHKSNLYTRTRPKYKLVPGTRHNRAGLRETSRT